MPHHLSKNMSRERDLSQSTAFRCRVRVIICFLLIGVLLQTGCREESAIGDIQQTGSLSLIRFEALEDGMTGVVYRTVNDFDKLVAQSDVPLLVAFYQSQDAVNSLIIPCLEQMADDYQGQAQIVWVDANIHQSIATSFSVDRCPHFTMVVNASLKQSMIGFDEQGCRLLRELINRYIPDQM